MPSTVELVIVGVVLVLVVGGTFYLLLNTPERRARRALKRAAVPISSLVIGKSAKISGRVLGPATQRTLEGAPCVFAHVALLQFYRRTGSDGAISESWRVQIEEQRGAEVKVADDTGAVCVVPAGATWMAWARWKDVDWNQLSTAEAALIDRAGDAISRGAVAKLREHVLVEGDHVTVFGSVVEVRSDGTRVLAVKEQEILAIGDDA